MTIDFLKLKRILRGQPLIGFADLAESQSSNAKDSSKLSTSKRGTMKSPTAPGLTTTSKPV